MLLVLLVIIGCAACAPLPHRDWDEGDALPAHVASPRGFAPGNATAGQRADTADRIWQTIVDTYYDPTVNGIDVAALRARTIAELQTVANDDAFYTVLRRDVGAVGDSHTGILSPERTAEKRSGRGVRFGLRYGLIEGRIVVTGVEPGFSASEVGVRVGMIIEAIDGVALDAAFLERATDHAGASRAGDASERAARAERGLAAVTALFDAGRAEGVTHRLALLRGDDTRSEAVLVARSGDLAPQVTYRSLPSGVGVLRIDRFDDAARPRIGQGLAEARADARALIVDLRGNPGGTDTALRALLDELFDRPKRVLTYLKRPALWLFPSGLTVRPVSGSYRKPLAVLIDGATGSIAEVAALVLAEQRAALLVGEATCGCVVGVIGKYVLPDGGALRVAAIGLRSARGRNLERDPLHPDVTVTPVLADLRAGRDTGVATAETALLAKIAAPFATSRQAP